MVLLDADLSPPAALPFPLTPPPHTPQAIQHIEGTQGKGCSAGAEEEQRRAVIVSSGRVLSDAAGSDTASNSDGPDDCSLP